MFIEPKASGKFFSVFSNIKQKSPLPGPSSTKFRILGFFNFLLLNSILTVRKNCPGSHSKKGWENFTDEVISILSKNKNNLVFLLWGNYAKSKLKIIDQNNHFILTSSHPSPFSANNGFFNSFHFSQTNSYLKKNKIKEIKW